MYFISPNLSLGQNLLLYSFCAAPTVCKLQALDQMFFAGRGPCGNTCNRFLSSQVVRWWIVPLFNHLSYLFPASLALPTAQLKNNAAVLLHKYSCLCCQAVKWLHFHVMSQTREAFHGRRAAVKQSHPQLFYYQTSFSADKWWRLSYILHRVLVWGQMFDTSTRHPVTHFHFHGSTVLLNGKPSLNYALGINKVLVVNSFGILRASRHNKSASSTRGIDASFMTQSSACGVFECVRWSNVVEISQGWRVTGTRSKVALNRPLQKG